MQVHQNYSLKNYNSFGIEAKARYFSRFASAEELRTLLSEFELPLLILGGGSNLLFTGDYSGLVLKNEVPGINVVKEDEAHTYLRVGAGENWHGFVMHCVSQGLGGVENLSLIPGNAGASPMQNIGAYGVEIKDVFHELEAFHLEEKIVKTFSAQECEFGYRESVFKKKWKNKFAILNVTYRLTKKPIFNISYGAVKEELEKMNVAELSLQAVSNAIIHIRSSKLPDPKNIGNAGSFFKNPVITDREMANLQNLFGPGIPMFKADENQVKIPAGWLIEQCGWKGFRKGDAGCYPKQALVLVNYGHATGKEIYQLSEEIKISVKEKFGIVLEREVNIF